MPNWAPEYYTFCASLARGPQAARRKARSTARFQAPDRPEGRNQVLSETDWCPFSRLELFVGFDPRLIRGRFSADISVGYFPGIQNSAEIWVWRTVRDLRGLARSPLLRGNPGFHPSDSCWPYCSGLRYMGSGNSDQRIYPFVGPGRPSNSSL